MLFICISCSFKSTFNCYICAKPMLFFDWIWAWTEILLFVFWSCPICCSSLIYSFLIVLLLLLFPSFFFLLIVTHHLIKSPCLSLQNALHFHFLHLYFTLHVQINGSTLIFLLIWIYEVEMQFCYMYRLCSDEVRAFRVYITWIMCIVLIK